MLPFTVADEPLKPLFHMASVIGEHVPVWDSQPEFGDTDMLVNTLPMGHSLAKALGQGRAALIRGHGAVAVGESIRNLVMTSVYLKENAELVLHGALARQAADLPDAGRGAEDRRHAAQPARDRSRLGLLRGARRLPRSLAQPDSGAQARGPNPDKIFVI